MNPLVTQSPNSGDYAAQGIELDFNNNNVHRGDSDAGTGLGGAALCYGLSVSGGPVPIYVRVFSEWSWNT